MKYNLVNFCEFDKHAVKSYCAIHGTDEALNLGDITRVDEKAVPHFNVICGGSPCQDFSIAGKQAGATWTCKDCGNTFNPLTVHFSDRDTCQGCGSKNLDKTRSSLLVEWLRMIRGTRPDWGIYENVKNIVGKKFRNTTFRLFEEELHEYGYNTYWKVLNAKHYGIPQNRERVYLILIKEELDNGQFKFPQPLQLYPTLNDVLEERVAEKYYLPPEKVKVLVDDMGERKAMLFEPDETEFENFKAELKLAGNINGPGGYQQSGRIYFPNGCSPAVVTARPPKIVSVGKINKGFLRGDVMSAIGISPTHLAGNEQIKIVEKNVEAMPEESHSRHLLTSVSKDDVIMVRQATEKGYAECVKNGVVRVSYPQSQTRRGRVQEYGMISPTLLTSADICRVESLIRIRKLTPLECFRLMGFEDADYERAKGAGVSEGQLYKQTGNSIVVDVLFYIFQELYEAMPYLFDDVQLASFFTGIGAFEKAFQRLEQQVNQ